MCPLDHLSLRYIHTSRTNCRLVAFSQTYWWHDKFRPRKPRYFNRVKTGYDWNKYNQTHYDHDNPPPKTVQVREAPSVSSIF